MTRARATTLAAFLALTTGCVLAEDDVGQNTWIGDYELQSANGLVQLVRLRQITGTLRIQSTASLDLLSLPNLSAIDGDLVVRNVESIGTNVRIAMPSLRTVGGGITVENNSDPMTISAPQLGRIDSLRVREGSYALELDQLIEVRGAVDVRDVRLEGLDLAAVERIGGGFRFVRAQTSEVTGLVPIPVRLDAVASIGGGLTVRGTTPVNMTAGGVASIGGDLALESTTMVADLARLQEIDGNLSVRESNFDINAPLLQRIRGQLIVDDAVFDGEPRSGRRRGLFLPALTTVERTVRIQRVQRLQSVELPVLSAVGAAVIITDTTDLELVDVSSLTQIFSDFVLENLFRVEVRASALTQVDGPFRVRTMDTLTLDAPNLTRVGQDFELSTLSTTSLQLGSLREVGRRFTLQRLALSELDLDELRNVGSDFAFENSAGLETLSLARLEEVGMSGVGDFRVVGNFDIAEILVPRLLDVRGRLEVRDNPALDPEILEASFSGVEVEQTVTCGNLGQAPC